LVGFPAHDTEVLGDGGLLANTANAVIRNGGYWQGTFNSLEGMSGGPLLTAKNQIVGVDSQALFDSQGHQLFTQADAITTAQLNDIKQWMLLDQQLLPANSTAAPLTVSDGANTANIALLGQYMASSFVASAGQLDGTPIPEPPPATLTQMLTKPL
jgi:hypothetical protein